LRSSSEVKMLLTLHLQFTLAAHIDDSQPVFSPGMYRVFSYALLILLVVGIVAVVGGLAFIKSQEKSRKRFF
jgi:hypothetical protein